MENNKSLKITLLFTVCFFILVIFVFSVWKTALKRTNSSDNDSDKTLITATFYPLYIILLNLTENVDSAEVSLLSPADTGCLHDYQLTTNDMKSIERCDILVVNGNGMEDFLDKALEVKKDSVIAASDGFDLIDGNPHVWVSLSGAIYETKRITEGLCRLDQRNSDKYKENSLVYIEKLSELEKRMKDELSVYAGSKIITFHEAFPYFAEEFGLEMSAVIEREPGTVPSARELTDMIGVINLILNEGDSVVLFAEPQYSSGSAEIIARETGLSVYELDPAVTGDLSKDAYLRCMEKNLNVLKESLSKAGK